MAGSIDEFGFALIFSYPIPLALSDPLLQVPAPYLDVDGFQPLQVEQLLGMPIK